jgi:hypothetical protein
MKVFRRRRISVQVSGFSILEIIFMNYEARFFCEIFKLPKEMPKIAKCLKCLKLRYSVDFNKLKREVGYNNFIFLNSGLQYARN